MIEVVLPLSLIFIMFNIGLSLTPDDFRRVIRIPKGVAVGMVNLLLVSPFLAAIVATVFDLDPVLAVGLVLLGAAPGGTMANMYTHLAKGETALSVTLTALSSVLCVITVPLYLKLADNHFGGGNLIDDVNMLGVAARVVVITLLPLGVGMFVRRRRPDWTDRRKPGLDRAALIVFVLVVAAAVASEWSTIVDNFAKVALATLTLNLLAMGISFGAAKALRLTERAATAIALELGIHNATVAITVGSLLGDDAFIVPAGVYSLFMFINGTIFARYMSRRNRSELAPAGA
ncbi:MAG: bile acid:sodium symporter family protein [Thermoleophilia bacterium]|nr:bile acid:sodium symporter family protein [Thermoleophilia bacterium]